jgi:hypothetical protein
VLRLAERTDEVPGQAGVALPAGLSTKLYGCLD